MQETLSAIALAPGTPPNPNFTRTVAMTTATTRTRTNKYSPPSPQDWDLESFLYPPVPGFIPVDSEPMRRPLVPSKLITISRRHPGDSGSFHFPAHFEGAVDAA